VQRNYSLFSLQVAEEKKSDDFSKPQQKETSSDENKNLPLFLILLFLAWSQNPICERILLNKYTKNILHN